MPWVASLCSEMACAKEACSGDGRYVLRVCPGGSMSFLRSQAAQKKGAIGCSRGGDVDVCWCKEERESDKAYWVGSW